MKPVSSGQVYLKIVEGKKNNIYIYTFIKEINIDK